MYTTFGVGGGTPGGRKRSYRDAALTSCFEKQGLGRRDRQIRGGVRRNKTMGNLLSIKHLRLLELLRLGGKTLGGGGIS